MSRRASARLAAARRCATAPAGALLAAAALAAAPAVARAAPAWRLPVDGTVAGRFSYDPGAPFARGARRGMDLAAAPGASVRAACRGVVTWTGRLPGSRARGVTIRCGGLVATHLGLAAVAVRRGEPAAAGARLGTLGPGGVLRLGARRAGSRAGYVDPAALIDEGPPGVAPPAALGRPRRGPAKGPAPRAPTPQAAPHGRFPAAVWVALALLGAGAGAGAARAARRPLGRRAAQRARPRPLPR